MINGLPKNLQSIVNELLLRGIICKQIPKTCIIEASTSLRRHFLSQYTLPIIPQIYAKLLDNKKNFKDFLKYHEIPFVLPYKTFQSNELDKALEFAKILQFPVACKPQHGMGAKLVVLAIQDPQEFIDAWKENYFPLYNSTIIVERYLPNISDYRFFCFKNHEPAVLARHDPCLIGDGKHTIFQLIAKENLLRTTNSKLMPLVMDDKQAFRVLKHQGFTVESIPNENQIVKLSYGADINRGAIYEVVDNNIIDKKYWQLIHTVWSIFPKMPYFSVDLLIDKINLSPIDAKIAINEAHVGASADLFLNPVKGQAVNLYANFVDLLFPETSTILEKGKI